MKMNSNAENASTTCTIVPLLTINYDYSEFYSTQIRMHNVETKALNHFDVDHRQFCFRMAIFQHIWFLCLLTFLKLAFSGM